MVNVEQFSVECFSTQAERLTDNPFVDVMWRNNDKIYMFPHDLKYGWEMSDQFV